ncbi:hypothetical protein X942_2231 [Burkholderia pseudomallei MSHR5596]|nr:hypothetical protein X942_2231 [Burkholderia pseudomallei MSHR5596]
MLKHVVSAVRAAARDGETGCVPVFAALGPSNGAHRRAAASRLRPTLWPNSRRTGSHGWHARRTLAARGPLPVGLCHACAPRPHPARSPPPPPVARHSPAAERAERAAPRAPVRQHRAPHRLRLRRRVSSRSRITHRNIRYVAVKPLLRLICQA